MAEKDVPLTEIRVSRANSHDEDDADTPYFFKLQDLLDLNEGKDLGVLARMGGPEGLAVGVGSNANEGLGKEEADVEYRDRINAFGRNVHDEPPHKNFFELCWDALHDLTLIILSVLGFISLILGLIPGLHPDDEDGIAWLEGAAILAAVVLVTLVTAWNDWNKDKQFRALNAVKDDRLVKVIRGGEKMQINIHNIYVGDVVSLDTGDIVPADGIYIKGFSLEMDESVMTGESVTVFKSDKKPFMLSGCLVADGMGEMLVTGVGVHSEWGQMLSNLQVESDDTPLQIKLDAMATLIGKIGTLFAVLTFLVLIIQWTVQIVTKSSAGGEVVAADVTPILNFFIISVTIVVVAVPEGLPLAVTISLAYSMGKMLKDNNLVRHLQACETMGGATNICSDKTGTLTLNRMTVVQGWFAGTFFDRLPEASELPKNVLALLAEGVSLNSKAFIRTEGGITDYVGSKTECALLVLAQKLGFNYDKIRQHVPIKQMYSFNSKLKRMSVLIDRSPKVVRIYTKGASEIVLERCKQVMTTEGEVAALDDKTRGEIRQSIDNMANQALRTLLLAYADFETDTLTDLDEAPDHDLVCIGVVGIQDPVRPEVPSAVLKCQDAGIFVRMVTGDNLNTAVAIAKECGILHDNGLSLEGPVFRNMSDNEIDSLLPRLQVLARSSPTDKHKLVSRLRQNGEVVAVTGDGTNDAPALKEADIGLSMGIAGTEVAKEASDVVILDDNFSSIVQAVMWGRSVFDNIRRFMQFQLTVNVVALVLALIGAAFLQESPVTAIQFLWVNLIMDSMGALALATEPPTPDLLRRKPYGRHERLLSPYMIRNIAGPAVFQLIVLFVLLFQGCAIFDLPEHDCNEKNSIHFTIIFNAFVFCQIFNEFNSRKIEDERNIFAGIKQCRMFSIIIVITIAVQIIIVENGTTTFNTHPLSWSQWLVCVIIGLCSIPVGVLTRFIPARWFQVVKIDKRTMWTQTADSELDPAHHEAGAGIAYDSDNDEDKEEETEEKAPEEQPLKEDEDTGAAEPADVKVDVEPVALDNASPGPSMVNI